MRHAPQAGQMPQRLQKNATSFFMMARITTYTQKAMGQNAAFKKGLELRFDELG